MGYDLVILTTPIAAFGLNWLAQSSLLIVLGIAAGRGVRRRGPALQSVLYRTTLAAVLICPIASAVLAATGFEGVNLRRAAPREPIAASDPPQSAIAPLDEPMPSEGVHAPSLEIKPSRPSENQPAAASPTHWISPGNAARWGVAAWFLGSIFLLVRLAVQQARMRRLRLSAHPAEAEAEALCAALATRMNLSSPIVCRTPFLFSPCLDGLRRPAILLPEDVDEDLHDAFVHELAHLARRDGLWNLVLRLSSAFLWFQPLLWALSRRLESSAEDVCDDYVVHFGADRARYAGLLVAFAGRALPPRGPAAVCMISARSILARRVRRVLDSSQSLSTRAGKNAMLATLALGISSTAFAGLLNVGGRPLPSEATEPPVLEKPPASGADVPITGRIVDPEGRPIAGVAVKVEHVNVPKGDDLTAWVDGVTKGEPPWVAAQEIDRKRKALGAEGREATTDADGRFRLEGLGAERVVELSLKGETIAYNLIEVVLRKLEPFTASGYPNHYGPGVQTIFGADFTYTAEPCRVVEGVVKDARTGEPLADAGVWSYRFAGSDFVGNKALKTRTDARGTFRLTGMPSGKGNTLLIVPNDEQPYFMRKVDLPDAAGTEPNRVEVVLEKGLWIEGKLTDRETGKPISRARLHYMPLLTNTYAQARPEFDEHGNTDAAAYQDRYQSSSDGSFRIVGLPGRAIVGAAPLGDCKPRYMQGAGSEAIEGMDANGLFKTFRNPVNPGRQWPAVLKEINPPSDAQSFHLDLQATQGDSVRIRIAASDGRPISMVETVGRESRGRNDPVAIDGPEGSVLHLYPGEERTVVLRDKDKKLGKVVQVRQGDDADSPFLITLEPLAAIVGIAVGPEGTPIMGVRVRTDPLPQGNYGPSLGEVTTDEQGRFHVPDVPVGCDYALMLEYGTLVKNLHFANVETVVVRPGDTTDVGKVRFKKD